MYKKLHLQRRFTFLQYKLLRDLNPGHIHPKQNFNELLITLYVIFSILPHIFFQLLLQLLLET